MNNSNKNSNPNATVQIPNYQILSTLYSGSRTLVYRAVRTRDQLPVIIKLLKNEYPTFSELVQFRNQYTIAKNLNSPLIIQTYSLEPYQNGYALLMEDFGGISLHEWVVKGEKKISLREFLVIAIAICNTLDILYRERIIHKDIKPSNILINPDTKQVKLIDFSIASLLPRETQTLINPNLLEGTLAYISPEQTGRMNRGIDYRTDFYSLGVTFYELLTGELPFQSKEPMELVHCHIAKASPLVHEINSEIPSVISEIVNKLMAKNAENRYQSTLGLKFDLETCLHQLQETGEIQSFEIARRDACDRFIIPDKLYGRETEAATLLQAFERVANPPESPLAKGSQCVAGVSPVVATGVGHRGVEMMLVAGFSGIGKTAVVNEVHKPIVRQRGYFIKGKYDQFNRNIPLSAFVQALRDLMAQLLSESDTQLTHWKEKILSALCENGQVLIDVIPELEQIIGKQPAAPELGGSAAQNRFNLLFGKFIALFATQQHPLVMFLDDLQWADSASLSLMQVLMSQSEMGYLLMIGAYRDNEVFPAHPLMLTLEEMKKNSATISTLTLAPLSQSHVNRLVADTLSCSKVLAQPLSELVYQKTKGNPFFATQFLKALHQDGCIAYNFTVGHWQCDMVAVKLLSLTDDVVEFMAMQLQKLPDETQNALKLAACIGAQFDLETLAIVSEQSPTDAATALWKALQEGLILPTSQIYKFFQGTQQSQAEETVNPSYRFLHDRVQQAAYSLIPDDQKQTTHYQIGQLLLQQISTEAKVDRIFEVVNQLNHGTDLITQQTERDELAKLNLTAGRKARAATAYQAAREYAAVGLSLLPEEAWQQQYEMSLALHELAAEVAYLCGNLEQMEEFIQPITTETHSLLEQVNVYRIRIQANTSHNQPAKAISIGQKFLQQLGVTFPEAPKPQDIGQKIQEIRGLIGDRKIEELANLPVMTDGAKLAIVQIANSMIPTASQTASPLLPLLICLSIKLSIQYGNTSVSAFSYVTYGVILCNVLKDIDTAIKFGQLALQVNSKIENKAIKAQILNVLGLLILHRKLPIRETLSVSQDAYINSLEVGNLEFAGYAAHGFCLSSFWCGQPLVQLEQDTRSYCNQLIELNQLKSTNHCRMCWQSILNLLGFGGHPNILSGEALQEMELLPQILSANDLQGLYFFYLYKLMLGFLFGQIEPANTCAAEGRRYLMAVAGRVVEPPFYLYDSLIVLALLSQDSDTASELLERVAQNQTQLRQWAHFAPMNHQHKVDLVEAEKCRVLGQKAEAIEFYDKAISGANANDYIQEAALANELAAKFYLDWGKARIAQEYTIEAYYSYARWGAKAKVADLEIRYPQLLAPILQQTRTALSVNETIFATATVTSTSSSSSVSDSLDLAAILKASQTLSSAIELDKLLTTLLHTVMQTAGANKCVLMLQEDEALSVQAIAQLSAANQIEAIVQASPVPVQDSREVPISLINSVKRSLQPVVVTDATAHPQFATDVCIQNRQIQSILCSPILHQGKLLGLVYLENNLATGAFTRDRVELLNLLCAQAAISLENARLYQQVQQALEDARLMQFFIDRVVTPVCWVEPDARISYANHALCQDWGYPREEIVGRYLYEFNSDFSKETWAEHWQAIRQQGSATVESRICTPGGDSHPVEVTINYLTFKDKEYHLTFVVNISERKKAELALQQKSQDLQQALQDLQQAQLQIVQSEKMSALGNLVAGVAHEMNNPLGFIAASLKQTQPTVTDITEHLKLYQETFPNKSEEIIDHAEEIDLDYSLSDLPKVIDAMGMACDRLKNISTSLRTFSRADRDYKVPFNIHEGIDSTILILKHRLKANSQRPAIEVVTNYGNFPQIECFPGQLNQVFMNILANAIDALDESNIGRSFAEIKANPNCITIQTSLAANQVRISIADNGKGMSESVKYKIFDHLFTTKSVGRGTGLGLAIARQIVVEKHGGSLNVNSVLGEGTEFIITLPTQGK